MKRRFNKNDYLTILVLLPILVVLYYLYLFFDFLFDNIEVVLQTLVVSAIIVVIIVAVVLVFCFCIKHTNKKYDKFVYKHSIVVKQLLEINSNYQFLNINDCNYQFKYDNEIFFDTITPKDYLIYQLQYSYNDVKTAILSANENAKNYVNYQHDLKAINGYRKYDVDKLPLFKFLLYKKEEKIFNNLVQNPKIDFKISVRLILTNIHGFYKTDKKDIFNSIEISKYLEYFKDKSGFYYKNDEIWQSICKVERGKVTNKLRFFVYKRDRNRCVKCGSKYDLEVDHIFPISKGGKSTPDNLQTLCHNCNTLKSNDIENGAIDPKIKRINEQSICPICGAPTVLKRGKYSEFIGCTRYPDCKYTKSLKK